MEEEFKQGTGEMVQQLKVHIAHAEAQFPVLIQWPLLASTGFFTLDMHKLM